MANNTIISDVFKFVSLRPPVSVTAQNNETNFIIDKRQPNQIPLASIVKNFNQKNQTEIEIELNDFIKKNNLDLAYPNNLDNQIPAAIHHFISSISKLNFSVEALESGISNILDNSIPNYLDNIETQKLIDNIWDSYYAFYLLSNFKGNSLEWLTKYLIVFHVLNALTKSKINNFETLQNYLLATPLIDKAFTLPLKKISNNEEPLPPEPIETNINAYKELWSKLIITHRAIDEIKTIKFESKLITETKNFSMPNKELGMEEKGKITFLRNNIAINKHSFNKLHPSTKELYASLQLDEKIVQMEEPIYMLQKQLQNLYQTASNIDDIGFFEQMPNEAKLLTGISTVVSRFNAFAKPSPFIRPTNIRSLIKPLGIGDLKIVKQKLKRYFSNEVAHIENVLRGEYKERKHRVLDRTEDIFMLATENNEETTKDTQTTERFELKKESEKTISEQMSVQAGVTVSGSYGMVTFGAHGDFAYSTASKEASKNASNFAREVIDKSVSNIQKKSKEERTSKKLHEVEEINTHGIDNKDKPDHAVGIYRWVDKVYEAQIYNYGKRMMFEFIIPEPAAFYEYAQNNKTKVAIKKPKDLNENLTHKDITEYNYNTFIRDYEIQGVTPPPPLFKTVSIILSSDANITNGTALTKTSKELIVPEGYLLHQIGFSLSTIYENFVQLKLSIGANDYSWAHMTNNRARQKWDALGGGLANYDGIVPVSINCYDVNSFFVNVTATCIRTDIKYEQWQIQTFEKIMLAYKAMMLTYEQKLAAENVQQGITIKGQNPAINREIEKTELKKQCIKMLLDTYIFGSFDAMGNDGKNGKGLKINSNTIIPDFDIVDAQQEGKAIQFLEQAFEWENLTYLFFPYFWARKDQWVNKSTLFDTDPLFTKFLQAGSSRVVLPVHPAYNNAIMYFLENNGAIWNGGETPRLNDPLYISLADEFKNQTDDLANATPEGEPWEVILPTTLVYLQKDADLPVIQP